MMTTEELDALQSTMDWHGALTYEQGFGVIVNRVGHQIIALAPGKGVSRDETAALILAVPAILSAARQAETLRAKLAETEQARHEARFYGNQVAAERDGLQSRLNQAEHKAKMLTAKLIESETWRTELRQEMDAVKGRLREVTAERDALKAQRDELREAATTYIHADDNLSSAFDHLCRAVEAAR